MTDHFLLLLQKADSHQLDVLPFFALNFLLLLSFSFRYSGARLNAHKGLYGAFSGFLILRTDTEMGISSRSQKIILLGNSIYPLDFLQS